MHNLWEAKVECLSLCAKAAMDHDDFYVTTTGMATD